MKKGLVFIVISLFLIGFLGFTIAKSPFSITASAINNNSEDGEHIQTQTENQSEEEIDDDNETDIEDEEENETEIEEEECDAWTCTKWSICMNGIKKRACTAVTNCTNEENETPKVSKSCNEKEKIKSHGKNFECPEKCTCTGSVTKCVLNGTREMTVIAGKSGNVIIQVKGVNGTTEVTLYKADDGKIYAVNKNNETFRIKLLPDQVKEKIKERVQRHLENENITLDENGDYEYKAKKKARLFFLIPVEVDVEGKLNSETGKIIEVKNSWWAFLAKDDEGEQIVGASCGTVTPGYNNECCQNKGYDVWNSETGECEFNSSSD